MKKTVVSIFLLLLALAMLLSTLTACGEKTPEKPDDGTGEKKTVEEGGIAPLEERDLKGKTFNVLLRSEYKDEFDINEETNTPIPDAVYRRNEQVQRQYNMVLNFKDVVDDWDHRDTFTNAISNSIIAGGDTAFDFIIGAQSYIAFNIAKGDLLDLNTVPNLTFEGEWWGQQAVDALTVNNVCYQATGDFAVSMLRSMTCMLFNKGMAEQYELPDLYQTVKDKKWTHEEMVRITRDIYVDDENPFGQSANDTFGLVMFQSDIRSAIVVYNTPTLTKEGSLIWNTERTGNVVTKIHEAFNNYEGIYYSDVLTEPQTIFAGGRALLLWGKLESASIMRDQENLDYGIIPCPMFTEDQGEYYTTSNDASMVCIPKTEKSLDDIGFAIEAICRASTDTVAKTVYEKSLKLKDAQDPQSSDMIDLIRKSLTYDFGWVYSTQTMVSGNQYENMMKQISEPNFDGWYKGQETIIKDSLKKFYAFFGVTLEG